MIFVWILLSCCVHHYAIAFTEVHRRPHIITIIADDLGWNDVGFHGSNQIPTPNIDALAYNGVILNRHYTQATCTPSRAALLTGKYPIRYGLQGPPIYARVRVGLPLNEKLLPQYLKELGYVTRLVGKWHLGYYQEDFTPLNRGFDSHFGYYNGWVRYNDSILTTADRWGYDARDNYNHAGDRFHGKYATDVFTEEAINIIKNHDTSEPLFLDVSHLAVHACLNNILQVKNETEINEKFANIKDPQRRLFAGILTNLDENVGKLIAALDRKKMLENSIILFIADNGGATEDNNTKAAFKNSASNWPLRGWKTSVADGGVRGVATIWSPLINSTANSVSNELIHISDWLPTFYAAAGGDVQKLGKIDGVNQWHYLTGKQRSSQRKEVLLNINELTNDSAIIANGWKYIQLNSSTPTNYKGASGRDDNYAYNMEQVLQSETHTVLKKFSLNNTHDTSGQFATQRSKATIDNRCLERIEVVENSDYSAHLGCFRTGCLFNIKSDPCEFTDLSQNEPILRSKLENKLNMYRKQLIPQQKSVADPECDPRKFHNYWTPWIRSHHSWGHINTPNSYILLMAGFASVLTNYVHHWMLSTVPLFNKN